MSTLYIRLPSKAASEAAAGALTYPFALSQGETLTQQGTAPLSELSGSIARAQRIVLLLAAGDVTLLRVKVPPLTPARLKSALPNLVEDYLLNDPSHCVIVAGKSSEGLRTVAVIQRAWLDSLAKTFAALGARQITALPAQLCLPCSSDPVTAITGSSNDHDLTLRLSEHEGIGLAIPPGEHETATGRVIDTLNSVAPSAQITLYVPQASLPDYQQILTSTGNHRISVLADNWPLWITGCETASLDLMAGLGRAGKSAPDFRAWRWPLALAAAAMLINIAALNLDWWHLRREENTLRSTLLQTYQSAYPKETVIIDPIAQMRQKIAAAKRNSGLAAPDDFTAILAAFGEAWATVSAGSAALPAIAAFEYREHSLLVRLQPGGAAPTQQMQAALAGRNLSLALSPVQSAGVMWEIRSAK